MNHKILKVLFIIVSTLFLTACGGGGSSTDNGGNSALTTQERAIQTIADYAQNGGAAPTVKVYTDAGIKGVTKDNLAQINAAVENLEYEDVDTSAEIQALFDSLGLACVQVITHAYDPATGEEMDFPTPCDVPQGWVVGTPASEDNQKPVLILYGASSMRITLGDAFIDPGASAMDDRDGNITDKITINSNIDTTKVGTYVVRYDVRDKAGNAADTVRRTVKVVAVSYGNAGSHKVLIYEEKDANNSIVYYPSDISQDHKTPLIFFCPGWNSNDPASYDVLLRFIASHGYSVIYAKDYYGDIDTFIERFEKMLDDKNDVLPYVDTTRIGVLCHSSGGGDTFAVLKYFSDKGYGKNGRFLMSLDGWFAFGMNSDAMRHLPANTNVVMQRYSQPDHAPKNGQDPRITWSEYALLDSIPEGHKDYQVYSPATHSYMKQDSIDKMQGLLRPLDALMQYTFEGKESAHDDALENGNDHPWENSYEEFVEPWRYDYRCNSHKNRSEVMEIDYCHQYEGAKRYPADTDFDDKPNADPAKPAYLESYVDSVFGNKVTRITDRANQSGNAKPYPKTQVWNADMSLIRLGYHLYKGDDFSESPLTHDQHLRGSLTEMKWSGYEPDVFYGIDVRADRFVFMKATIHHDNNTIAYEVMPNATFMKSEYDELKLGKYEGNLDYQDNYVVFAGRKKDSNRVTLIVYHLKDNYGTDYNRIEANVTTDMKWYVEDANGNFTTDSGSANQMFDWASISALGNYVIVNYRSKKGDAEQEYTIEQYYKNLTHVRTLANTAAHGDLGVDANGKEVYVQFGFGTLNGESNLGIWMYPLDGSPRVQLLPDKYNGGHISCRNYQRPGWCYVNTRYLWHGNGVREAFAIKLDNSHTVERFAQTHNSTEKAGLVQVNVSPDGTQLLFNSDWGDVNSVIETYHVSMPSP